MLGTDLVDGCTWQFDSNPIQQIRAITNDESTDLFKKLPTFSLNLHS